MRGWNWWQQVAIEACPSRTLAYLASENAPMVPAAYGALALEPGVGWHRPANAQGWQRGR